MKRDVFKMPDGASLPAFVWNGSSEGAPRAVFIGIHGLGANGTAFELPASRFAQLRDVDAWLADRSAPLPSIIASPPAAEEIAA